MCLFIFCWQSSAVDQQQAAALHKLFSQLAQQLGAGIGLKSVKVVFDGPHLQCQRATGTRTYPGTVVIEAIHAVVAQAAVRGARRPEDLAGEAVFQFDRLALDEHLLGAGRRPVCGAVQRVWHFCAGGMAATERNRMCASASASSLALALASEMQHQQRQRQRQSRC